MYHMPRTWEITTNHWYYSGTSTFPVAHIGNFYWKRMDFLIVTNAFSKYFLVRK